MIQVVRQITQVVKSLARLGVLFTKKRVTKLLKQMDVFFQMSDQVVLTDGCFYQTGDKVVRMDGCFYHTGDQSVQMAGCLYRMGE